MINAKKIILLLTICSFAISPAFSKADYEDVIHPKQPAYRIGTTNDIEVKTHDIKSVETKSVKEVNMPEAIQQLTFADLSLKRISQEIAQNLDVNYDEMMSDLSLLWQGAATKSDIIKFALYKLSNPDADKPNAKSVKKVLQTIANMSTLIGAGAGDAVTSGASFIGGNILGIMSQDDKDFNYKFTKVNDADMIILVRKIDSLQQKVMEDYYDYMTTRQLYHMASKLTRDRAQNYKKATLTDKRELVIISDAYYRDALDRELKARSDFYANRAKLEQLIGTETFNKFEENITYREQHEEK